MIGLDAGHSLDRPPTGVAAYCRNLIRALAAGSPDKRFRLFYRSNRYLRSFGEPLPANCSRALLADFALSRSARGLRLFHGLNQRLPAGLPCPALATFHDLFVMTAQYSTPEFRSRFAALARETAQRADCVIAVSAFTAGQVTELLGVPRDRVAVVHHGVEPAPAIADARKDALLAQLGIARPFLLNVGAVQKRKNAARIVKAFATLDADLELIFAGPDGYGADEIAALIAASPARRRIRRIGFVGPETRTALYARAEALVFASLDEGFGLPVIEAFAAGLPVIASDCSALPEVAGDAALLVDPTDVEAIAAAMQRIVYDSRLRNLLRNKGTARARRFTWERAARETWAVYDRLL